MIFVEMIEEIHRVKKLIRLIPFSSKGKSGSRNLGWRKFLESFYL